MLPINNRCPASNTACIFHRCAVWPAAGITFSFLFHQHFFCTLQRRAATSFNTKFEGLSLATVARHRYHLHSP
jgi:hypothetical protein